MTPYEKGSMPPAGYLQWHAWAEAQYKAGLRQKKCRMCALWMFPQERRACATCGNPAVVSPTSQPDKQDGGSGE